jgi:hypothetical protein
MTDYTLEEVIDFIECELDEAYESAYCGDIVESVLDAYDNDVITYEDADAYLSLMTEARRLDKEILKRKELIDKYDAIARDPEIPDNVKKKLYGRVGSQTRLRGPSGDYLTSIRPDRHKLIKDAVENRKQGNKISASLWNDDLKPAEERKPGKYLEIQKKLNNHDLTLPKKVNTKVSKDDGLY